MRTLEEAKTFLEEKAQELTLFDDPRERLQYIIELGNTLPELSQEFLTQQNLVPGCVSTVYIRCIKSSEGITIQGKSDALIVKGFLYFVIQALNDLSQEDILNESEKLIGTFLEQTKLNTSTLASRANAIGNILATIQRQVREL